jgi:hypothetical protein
MAQGRSTPTSDHLLRIFKPGLRAAVQRHSALGSYRVIRTKPWGDPMAADGELRWPPIARFSWPPSVRLRPAGRCARSCRFPTAARRSLAARLCSSSVPRATSTARPTSAAAPALAADVPNADSSRPRGRRRRGDSWRSWRRRVSVCSCSLCCWVASGSSRRSAR